MAVYRRGPKKIYYTDFWFAGQRIQESTRTTRLTLAREYEKNRRLALERALSGLPVEEPQVRIRTVRDCTKKYAAEHTGRAKTKQWIAERLAHIDRQLGGRLLPDLTEDRIRDYMKTRADEGVGGRTINMEVSILARAIGSSWKTLWPRVKAREERADIGVALSPEEESKLLLAVRSIRSHDFETYVRLLLLTAMRPDREALHMQWRHVDFDNQWIIVGRSKTAAGEGRIIPMNEELLVLMKSYANLQQHRYGELDPNYYLFPRRKPAPADPRHHVGSFKKAWRTACDRAGLRIRLYDCRHTMLTKLAESGASDSTIMAIAGHLSRRMLERYSHIRMKAKRAAMELVRSPRELMESVRTQSPAKVPTAPRGADFCSPQVVENKRSGG
ncbi:MAG TPA: site-specific integrase [Bryobacteraceae bacterium]|nr:site-specific integrase [Bryobacteraceae bacterium]